MREDCQIGKEAVPDNLRGRCLALRNTHNWKIIDNPRSKKYSKYTKLLVAEKKQ